MSGMVNSEELKNAMAELRALWNKLYTGTPTPKDYNEMTSSLEHALSVARKVARISEGAYDAALTAFSLRAKIYAIQDLADDTKETLAALQEAFEVKLGALRQLESGDHILPNSALELRKSAASDLDLYNSIVAENADTPKLAPNAFKTSGSAALEAVEFLLRLGS